MKEPESPLGQWAPARPDRHMARSPAPKRPVRDVLSWETPDAKEPAGETPDRKKPRQEQAHERFFYRHTDDQDTAPAEDPLVQGTRLDKLGQSLKERNAARMREQRTPGQRSRKSLSRALRRLMRG